jgi:hypothetical protein
MTALRWVTHLIFGCHHRDLSRVFTINQRTYQVCLDCGREVDYSWDLMRSLEPTVATDRVASLENEERAQASIN